MSNDVYVCVHNVCCERKDINDTERKESDQTTFPLAAGFSSYILTVQEDISQ